MGKVFLPAISAGGWQLLARQAARLREQKVEGSGIAEGSARFCMIEPISKIQSLVEEFLRFGRGGGDL